MRKGALILVLMGALVLSACVSGRPKQDYYTDRNGVAQVVDSDKQSCERSCNGDYERCGDTEAARRASIDSSQGLFGAGAGCSSSLARCLERCRGR